MSKASDIRELIRSIGTTKKPGKLFFRAKVKTVSDETCQVEWNGLLISDVQLAAAIDGNAKNLLIKPKVGSVVLVADLSEGEMRELAVISWSEVDTVVFNGGENEGIVKVKELTDKINTLENALNSLKTVFSGWVPVPSDGGAVLKTAIATWAGSQLSVTNKADIQNDKIKH